MNDIALQLYTVRNQLSEDVRGTLRKIANSGYRSVETAGYAGLNPEEFYQIVRDEGLRAVSSHVGWQRLEQDLTSVIREAQAFDVPTIVLPSLPPQYRVSEERYAGAAATMNQWGSALRRAGLEFLYHNHAFEFEELPSQRSGFDVLREQTDREVVGFEVDIYWVVKAHRNALQLLKELGDRVSLMHVKDIGPPPEEKDLPVGDGLMPWPEVLSGGSLRCFIVEQDHVWGDDVFQDIQTSWTNLNRLLAPTRPGMN